MIDGVIDDGGVTLKLFKEYKERRLQLKKVRTGDILLFPHGDDWLTKIIAYGTKSKYSHVSIVASSPMNVMIEAAGCRVRATDIRTVNRNFDIYRVRTSYKGEKVYFNTNTTVSHLVSKLNSRYDFLGVAYLGLLKALAYVGIPIKHKANKWQKDKDYFCSELTWECFQRGGIDICPNQPDRAEVISPGDIARSPILKKVV